MKRPARLLGPLAIGLSLSALPAQSAMNDPGCGEVQIVLRSNAVVYQLPHTFIRSGSDSLWTRDTPWRRGTDYVLDGLRGELRLLRDPVPGDTLHISTCWLLTPPPLELQLMRYRPAAGVQSDSLIGHEPTAAAASVRPVTSREVGSAPPGASLNLSGNKTIAVDFGSNQDAFLRQSLDLAVTGTLAPGVELTGVLSDRDTPLSAAGSTQDLKSLDRVRIELKAPQGNAALGDIPLDLHQGEFARLERRLQGVRGEWTQGDFQTQVAAASAPGEFNRLQFYGVEGRQGPYFLSDRNGELGVSIVAGSEVVTLDGARMTRGEGADYAIDYERARLTFTNRRPISSVSRITVDYQYSVNRYHRNLVAAGGRWQHGDLFTYVQGITESDDRGRPFDLVLDATDQRQLAAAGDSAVLAVGSGVASGGGDYDTVRVAGAPLTYVFVGRDSGHFAVQFARVGANLGDYADSTLVAGRAVYHFVGSSRGDYRVGRALPLPESHQLWSFGGGGRAGPLTFDVEGALTRLDKNTFSSRDDGDNVGQAGRATLHLEGSLPALLGGTAGVELRGRSVGQRFASFAPLEHPFAEQEWGLPTNADLEHQQRLDVEGFYRPAIGGEFKARLGRLKTPAGFASWRRGIEWTRDGLVATHVQFEHANGEDPGRRFGEGGRQYLRSDVRLKFAWVEPVLRFESDAQRTPSDSTRVGMRYREAGLELQSGRALAWHMLAGVSLRRDGRAEGAGFIDQARARTLRLGVDSPADKRLSVALGYQHREVEPLVGRERTRSDLGSMRLKADDPKRRLTGQLNLEVTSEGENRREKQLTYVGAGRGAYDALGNYVGTGDYNLSVVIGPSLDLFARAATSAILGWQFGESEVWRGSRVDFDFESETRRRGAIQVRDPVIAPDALLADLGIARGSLVQRLETELAPGSRISAVRLRVERRVSADRSFDNFAQVLDQRSLEARWLTRPAATVSTEVRGGLKKQIAGQTLAGGGNFRRVLLENGGSGQLVFTPDQRLRAAAVLEASWSRPESERRSTRTLKAGPDLGLAVGERGHAEFTLRRAFVNGPLPLGLIPTAAELLGTPTWEGTARLDYRVRETTNLGLSLTGQDRPARSPIYTGRAELRAFF